jgi:hypothetical protein
MTTHLKPPHRSDMATQAQIHATIPAVALNAWRTTGYSRVRTALSLLLALSVAFALSGCSSYPSPIDQQFGNTMRSLVSIHTVNSNAPASPPAVTLSDAQAAHAAVNRYQRSFEVPPTAPNVFNIGVGSNATGQAQ